MQKASYRGVPFFVSNESDDFGPQYLVHEYPLKEAAYTEHVGYYAKRYQLSMFVLGDDYQEQREALRKALAMPGPGVLIHPKLGRLIVVPAGKIKRSETVGAGGKASFQCTFVEYGGLPAPEQNVDTLSKAQQAADAVAQTAQAEAEAQTAVVDDYAPEAIARINTLNTELSTLVGRLAAVQQPIDELSQAVADLVDHAADLISSPRNLIASIGGIVAGVFASAHTIEFALSTYRNLAVLFPPQTPGVNDSPRRQQNKRNSNAQRQLLRQQGIAEAVRYVVTSASAIDVVSNETSPFVSYDHAIAVRNELASAIDAEIQTAGDQQRLKLKDMRSALYAHIEAHGADLARIETLTPSQPVPALVLAYQLYGDAARAEDIIARNHIRNGALISDKTELEVLSR